MGILLFGAEDALAVLDSETTLVSRKLPTRSLSRAGQVLSTAGELQAQSGRWLKLTKESVALVRKMGPSKAKADKLVTGVVRTGKGRILQAPQVREGRPVRRAR